MVEDKINSANIFFNNLSFFDAIDKVKDLSRSPNFSYVITPNIDHMSRVTVKPLDEELLSIYQNAALSLCDSRILDKLLRLKRKRIKEVVPGSTLTQYLFSDVMNQGDTILVVGVEDSDIEKLRQLYPSLTIQHINPSMGFINKPDEVESLKLRIQEINANYVFLCVGSPRQELLAAKLSKIGALRGVGLCVGASILFLVGAEKRSPQIIQKLHLEWVYRIAQNPRRLAIRYFKNFLSLPTIIKAL